MRTGWLEETIADKATLTGMASGVELTDTGCPFFARCPMAIEETCDKIRPPRRNDGAKHIIECHREIEELMGGGWDFMSVMPNILFVQTDQLTVDVLSAYGQPVAITPAIDRAGSRRHRLREFLP